MWRQLQRNPVFFVFNVVGVIFRVRYWRPKMIGQSFQVAQAKAVCRALIGKADDAVVIEQANEQCGLSGRQRLCYVNAVYTNAHVLVC